MGIAFKLSVSLYAAIILACGFSPISTSATELLGIAPFTNQRNSPADDWLGYYIQARLQAFLAEGCATCRFHPLSTIRLWQHQAHAGIPISMQNTVLITGSYQFVLDQGILDISLKRFTPWDDQKEFTASFSRDELELKLDLLFTSVAKWLQAGFETNNLFNYPRHTDTRVRKLIEFRQSLYNPGKNLDLNVMRKLKGLLSEQEAEFTADIAEGMIIASNQLLLAERKSLLNEAEKILRSAAMKYINNARIHALLAEVFFLSGKHNSWVIKSAEQARKLDETNSLALLMLILAESEEKKNTRDMVSKLNDSNPWIWPDQKEDKSIPQFQKGLFRSELAALQEFLR